MKNKTNIAPWLILAAICAGALGAPWILPWAEAQRTGYVEKQKVSTGTATGNSAFADQLAPNPITGMCLQPDVNNRTVWGPCGSTLPEGIAGQVLGVKPATATRTVAVTGTQTSVGTETYSYTTTATGTVTATGTLTETATNSITATYTYTENVAARMTYTYTGTTGTAVGTYAGETSVTSTGTRTQSVTITQTDTETQTLTNTQTVPATGTQTVATTGIYTASVTGTATATGSDRWTAVNGTIKAGDNIRLTKGTGTDAQTEVAMMDEPTVQLYSVDLPKTIRSTGATIPASGAGAELFYSPSSEISYLVSIDRGAAVHKPLNISGSSIRFAIENNVTMLVPETAGTEGDVLTKGGSNSSTWAPNIPIAPVTFTCATSATDLTITTSFTLGTGNGVVLSVGPITPKSTTTALRFRIGYQGKGIASTPLVANVQALTDPSYATWVANAGMVNTVGNGDYTSGFNDVVAWDAQWVNPTTFQLLMTGVLLPFATGSARACLEIEELRM